MTPAELAVYTRLKTRTNEDTFVDGDIMAFLNMRIDWIAQRILDADEDIFSTPQTTPLVVNQREYPFPSDILSRMKRVEAKLDGENWIPLREFDLGQYSKTTDEDTIVANFTNLKGGALYDLARKSIWIYSGAITDVAAGLKLWCETYPAHITDLSSTDDMSADPTTTTHGMPRETHQLLADGVVIDWKESKEKPIPLNERELSYEVRVMQAINTLKHGNLDREVIAHLPPASDRGNEGADF